MCVLYVSFWSRVRPKTFGCVAMGSAVLFLGPDCSYILQGLESTECKLFSMRLFCFVHAKTFVGMVVCIFLACVCVYVMVMSSA